MLSSFFVNWVESLRKRYTQSRQPIPATLDRRPELRNRELAAPAGGRSSRLMVTVIQARSSWTSLGLQELWRYRELLWVFSWRNIQTRYRQMALGPLWIILVPLINMVIFSFVFGKLARLPSDGVPYPLFTFTALLPWTYFANATSASVSSLLKAMNLISKVYFPRLILPLAAVLAGLVDLGISFLVLVAMMVYYGVALSPTVLFLPLYLLLAMALALSVGLWNTTMAVRFRDLQFATNYGLQIWMYATPVAYSARLISEQWQWLYQLNPMYWVVEGFRWSLLGQGQPPQLFMLVPVSLVLVMLISGAFVFQRTERTIVDLL